eukprot:SM000009S23590  [mRNA]  locus=s9:935073:938600:- [translate_table: standard]
MPWMDAAAAGACVPPAAAPPPATAEWLRVFRCSACRAALHQPPAGSARFRCGACGALLRAATSPLKPLQGGAKLAMAAAGPPLLLASRDLSPQSVVQGPYGGAFGTAGGSADMPPSPTSSLASSSPSLASSTAEAAVVSSYAASEHAGRGEPQPETEARAGSLWEEASIGDGVGRGLSSLFRLRMPAAAAAPVAEAPVSVAGEDVEEQFASPRSSSSVVSQAELAGAAVAEEEEGEDGSGRAMAESERWAVPRSREEFLALDPDVLEREWRQWSSPPPTPPPGAGPAAAVPSVFTIADDRSDREFAEITASPEIVAEPLELPVSFPAGTAGVSAATAPASAWRSLPLAMTAGRDHAGSGCGQAAGAAATPQLLTLGDNGLVAQAVVSPVSGSKDGAASSPSTMRKLRMLWFHRSKAAGGGGLRGPDLAVSAPESPVEAKGVGCTSPGTPVFRRAMEMPPDSRPFAPPGTTTPVLTAATDGGSHRRASAAPQLTEWATVAATGASPRSYYQRQNSLPAAALRSRGGESAAPARAAEAPPAMATVHETAFVLPSLPLAGEPPIVACQACGASLEMPVAALRPGRPADGLRWLRCGDCRQISTFATSSPRMARPLAATTSALPMEWPAAKASAAVLAFEVAQPVSAALAVAVRADGVDELDLPSYTPASLPSPSPYANIMYRLGDVELCDPADYKTDGNGGGDGASSRGRGALGLGRVVQKLRTGLRPLMDGSAEDLRRQRETLARFGGVSIEFSRRVVVNGLHVTDAAVAAAETKAGPIQTGSYWYDKRAGFWGMQGGPTMGVIPAHIDGFNEQLARGASGGDTGVLVNGRELPSHDLELLVRRGLPALPPSAKSGKGRRPAAGGAGSSSASSVRASYLLDIWGILHNASTGAPLVALGMLCPALEVAGIGAGMFTPAHPGGKRWIAIGEGEEMWRGP